MRLTGVRLMNLGDSRYWLLELFYGETIRKRYLSEKKGRACLRIAYKRLFKTWPEQR